MTFEELKNGMKDLFSSLGAKTSDSNYAVGLFDKTSAEPKGIMDFASLAKELGVGSFFSDGKFVLKNISRVYQNTDITIPYSELAKGIMIARTSNTWNYSLVIITGDKVQALYENEGDIIVFNNSSPASGKIGLFRAEARGNLVIRPNATSRSVSIFILGSAKDD